MGATSWSYFVPYQEDLTQALKELQTREYEAGNYQVSHSKADLIAMYEEELGKIDAEYDDPDLKEALKEDYAERLEQLKALPEPTTTREKIEELQAIAGEAGTHSILDMKGISEEPEHRMLAPLSDDKLKELFGTTQPSRAQVEEWLDTIQELHGKWIGTYVLIYDNGSPTEILFAGISGD